MTCHYAKQTGCIINEQVILQDQEGVLAWVSERLAVAMRQAEDKDNVLDKPTLMDLEARQGDKGQGKLRRVKKFEVSFKKTFSVKSSHLDSNVFSYGDDFGFQGRMSSKTFLDFIGLSKLNNQFRLSFFKNKIGKKLSTDIDQAMSLNNPFVNPPFMSRVFLKDGSSMLFRFVKIAKMFFYPIKKFFSCIGNVKNRSKVRVLVSIIFSGINSVNTNRSFSINDSGKISQFKRIIDNFFIFNDRHFNIPFMGEDDCTLSHKAA